MKREGDGMFNWLIAIAMGGLLFWMWLRQDQERMRSAREQAEQALRRAEQATKETGDRLKTVIEEGRERAEDLVDAGRARATELKSQADDARAEVQRRAAEFRQDVQEQADRVVDVAKDRIGDAREAVEDGIDQATDKARDIKKDVIATVEARSEVEPDFVEKAVAKTEERAEELREKLEDTMRETRLAAPPIEEDLPTLKVDTAIAPSVEEAVSRAHTLADQLREQAAANAVHDDLARIDGIGERSAEALYKGGITSFAQLAALTDDQIRAALDAAGVHPHNTLNTWREQAARFAQEQAGEQTQSDQS